MSAVAPVTSRALAGAATRRIATSSVLPQKVLAHFLGAPGTAPVWETVSGSDLSLTPTQSPKRSLRPCAARVSPIQHTICVGSDR